MALNSSGPISLGGSTSGQSINLELGRSASATTSLNETAVRGLAGISSGTISLSNFYGKSSRISDNFSYGGYNGADPVIVEKFNDITETQTNAGFTMAASQYLHVPLTSPTKGIGFKGWPTNTGGGAQGKSDEIQGVNYSTTTLYNPALTHPKGNKGWASSASTIGYYAASYSDNVDSNADIRKWIWASETLADVASNFTHWATSLNKEMLGIDLNSATMSLCMSPLTNSGGGGTLNWASFTFATETASGLLSSTSNNLTSTSHQGFGNANAGYWIGGWWDYSNTLGSRYKINFSNYAQTTLAAGQTTRHGPSAYMCPTKGYFFDGIQDGNTVTYRRTYERMTHSTETFATLGISTSANRWYAVGLSPYNY